MAATARVAIVYLARCGAGFEARIGDGGRPTVPSAGRAACLQTRRREARIIRAASSGLDARFKASARCF